MLIQLYTKWNACILALDKGYSHGHMEGLMEYGLHHPNTGLAEAIKFYDLGSSWSYIDPMTGVARSRPYKPLMVGITQLVVQEHRLMIPKLEDFESGVIGQMKRFHVERVSRTNQPIYSQGNEHTLTAMMLAIMAWQLEVIGFEPTTTDTTLAITIPPENREDDSVLPVSMRTPLAGPQPRTRKAKPKYPTRVPLMAPWPTGSRGIGARDPSNVSRPPRRVW
jgi:hypothetical protein